MKIREVSKYHGVKLVVFADGRTMISLEPYIYHLLHCRLNQIEGWIANTSYPVSSEKLPQEYVSEWNVQAKYPQHEAINLYESAETQPNMTQELYDKVQLGDLFYNDPHDVILRVKQKYAHSGTYHVVLEVFQPRYRETFRRLTVPERFAQLATTEGGWDDFMRNDTYDELLILVGSIESCRRFVK